MERTILVNGEERPLPENASVSAVAALYSPYGEGEPYFAVVNGRAINSITGDTSVTVEPGDTVEFFPLVIGG